MPLQFAMWSCVCGVGVETVDCLVLVLVLVLAPVPVLVAPAISHLNRGVLILDDFQTKTESDASAMPSAHPSLCVCVRACVFVSVVLQQVWCHFTLQQ